ncbi:FkbM family methyltransferase [Lentisalinibacter salinarum]|uniref:FkbM family methyltransferase n=1 Tax=Lentisalinibacter salinarum TaxID=2992239 RepID=UPI0038644417
MDVRAAAYVVNRFILRRPRLLAKADHFDLRLRVRTDDVIGRHIYKYGAHEPETTDFLKRTLDIRDGDVILDVGANIGWYSLVLDRIAGEARADIYAFEPDPENFALLGENRALNAAQRIHPVQLGVSDRAGTFELHLFGGSNRGRHSMLPIHEGGTIEIRTTTLDEFWAQEELGDRTPRFLKMDIEGFELAALQGAAGVLARCPCVMLEYSPRYMSAAGIEPVALLDFMTEHGYTPAILRDGALAPVTREELLASDRHVDLFWRHDG